MWIRITTLQSQKPREKILGFTFKASPLTRRINALRHSILLLLSATQKSVFDIEIHSKSGEINDMKQVDEQRGRSEKWGRKSARKNFIYDFHFSINLALVWEKNWKGLEKRRREKKTWTEILIYIAKVDSFE